MTRPDSNAVPQECSSCRKRWVTGHGLVKDYNEMVVAAHNHGRRQRGAKLEPAARNVWDVLSCPNCGRDL